MNTKANVVQSREFTTKAWFLSTMSIPAMCHMFPSSYHDYHWQTFVDRDQFEYQVRVLAWRLDGVNFQEWLDSYVRKLSQRRIHVQSIAGYLLKYTRVGHNLIRMNTESTMPSWKFRTRSINRGIFICTNPGLIVDRAPRRIVTCNHPTEFSRYRGKGWVVFVSMLSFSLEYATLFAR
jgi:hypothetical protein